MNLNNLMAVSCFIFPVSFRWSVHALRSRAVNSLVSCPMFELPQYVSSVGEKVIDQIRYCKLNIYIYTTIYSPTEWFANVLRSVPFAVPLFNSRNLIQLQLPLLPVAAESAHDVLDGPLCLVKRGCTLYRIYRNRFLLQFPQKRHRNAVAAFFVAFRRVRGVCRRPNATDLFTGHSDCWGHPLAI